MVKAVSRGQALQVSARVATQVNWDELDGDMLQQQVIILGAEEFGRRFTAFLKAGARMNLGPNILRIDRSKPFNPAAFIGQSWSIDTDKPQDNRSLVLTKIDLAEIRLVMMLEPGESGITGEERLGRLKEAGHILLDAKILQTLWENQDRIPEVWKEKVNGNTQFIFFDGTVLRGPSGGRFVLCLCFVEGGWYWGYRWLVSDWDSGDPSAVLASI